MKRWRAGRTGKLVIAAGMALAVAVPSLLLLKTADAVSPAPAKMPVDAADCAATSLTGFGAAPAGELLEGSCRRFTVDTRSPFLARASDADNKTLASAVYSFSGNLVCAVAWCDLTAGTTWWPIPVSRTRAPNPSGQPWSTCAAPNVRR